MTIPSEPPARDPQSAGDPAAYAITLGHLPAAAVLTAACAGLMAMIFHLGAGPPVTALILFTLLGGLVAATTPLPGGGIDAGSRVTLARIALVCLVGSAIGVSPAAIGDDLLWALVPIAAVTALLGAADGSIARSTGAVSAFGARLDVETGALFILILSVLLWRLDKAGVWVVAIGAMRYAFLAATFAWPALRGTLPASRRRQAVHLILIAALIVALAPVAPPLAAASLAGAALALLVSSFAIDIVWLTRHGNLRPAGDTPTTQAEQ